MTAKEKFSEVYKKNADRMYQLKTMAEIAKKQGDLERAREYRAEYIDLKSEIDTYAMQVIMEGEEI